MKPHIEKQVREHGENLNAIFGTYYDPVKLYRALRRIERKAHDLAEKCCNGEIDNITEEQETNILDAVDMLLAYRSKNVSVFFNKDPRGYALKINEQCVTDYHLVIEKDWGGYGILAPKFS